MIPVGDSARSRTTPWVTWAVILANVAVFLWMLGLSTVPEGTRRQQLQDFASQTAVCYGFRAAPTESDRFICRYGFQPREFFDTVRGEAGDGAQAPVAVVLSIVTAVFLHAGWLHLIGNMLFLWVFGDNVEDRLGHGRFLLFYLAGGVVAGLAQGFAEVDSVVPTVGASGAVAGVLAAYLVFYPRATVTVVIPFFALIFLPLPVPAILMIGLWFLQNLLAGLATINEAATVDQGVAWFAHIGGFLFGGLVAFFVRRT